MCTYDWEEKFSSGICNCDKEVQFPQRNLILRSGGAAVVSATGRNNFLCGICTCDGEEQFSSGICTCNMEEKPAAEFAPAMRRSGRSTCYRTEKILQRNLYRRQGGTISAAKCEPTIG